MMDVAAFKRQHRRDFLDLWDRERCADDMRLEVITRHLVGEYLPAAVIRAALNGPFPSRNLLDLAASWSDLRFDHETCSVQLRRRTNESPSFRRFMSVTWLSAYAIAAVLAWQFATAAGRLGPSDPTGWLCGIAAVAAAVIAFACVAKEHDLRQLDRLDPMVLGSLNASLRQARHGDSATPSPSSTGVWADQPTAALTDDMPSRSRFGPTDPAARFDTAPSGA